MGWQVVGTDGGSWAAAGRGVSEHTSLPSAMDAAALGGHTIINEAIERSKFIVRDIADPTAVELQQFSGGALARVGRTLESFVRLDCR